MATGFRLSKPTRRTRLVEERLTLLEESGAVHRVWRDLVVASSVSGVQVYDARLVAAMLTFNVRDFLRYPAIEPVHPQSVAQTRGSHEKHGIG